ncbi:PRC-barrel domain-containing protein [Halomonas icarae]|uniref:PRC-barrel domain containing protein n=1 Tax=Halomonas icarae TaxID=2691040 RepID=A0A7X4W1M4_9GAMM|nr:PRC-barrel domain-containing protein [Halomonas icarae]MDR5903427.1 PRC-barrel domain-containing protein [Halomonas icarae]NAW14319.1 PRC-barrel domain containing protein [Halomonas icarae]
MRYGKPLLRHATLSTLIAGGLVVSASAMAEPQGLYSSDELLDADVYTAADSREIGEVEDILLDNDMRVRALVIDTGELLDIDGDQEFVIEAGRFSVETHNGDDLDDIEYRVIVDMSDAQISQQPTYDNDWWQDARQGAHEAWEQTKEGAASAWETTQEGASRALDSIGKALENVGKKTQDAAE